jgi:hypothetical protein
MRILLIIVQEIINTNRIEEPTFVQKQRGNRKTIEDFIYLERSNTLEFSDAFRFCSCDQLRRLLRGFRFPDVIRVKGSKFSGEEALLITLLRLSYPLRWFDIQKDFPDRDRQDLKKLSTELLIFNGQVPGGFNVIGFIDNTMCAMCRVGGGPREGGERAA